MKTSEIRKSFLDYFKAKNHPVVKSDSLVPQNDPSVLFTGAGMNQFKDYFLGVKTDLSRAASVQKCLRTGDLDEVGKTPYHHSFFEMLGNFSFGDYFKEEAIAWAWEYLTRVLGISRDRLCVSVYEKDREALEIWEKKVGIDRNLIALMGDETNFWPSNAPQNGPNGPCGPCSEIYFDQTGENILPGDVWSKDQTGRFAEIWNLVFTQYDRQSDGSLSALKKKNIDTGMGLERLACVLQQKKTNFEIDIFEPILRALKDRHRHLDLSKTAKTHAVADHARAVAVAITDGAIPSNDGRGYVVRKLIRRAIWQGRSAGMNSPILLPLIPVIIETLEDAYPELRAAEKSVQEVVGAEERRFTETLDKGIQVLSKLLDEAIQKKQQTLSGDDVFRLYDTYGFPDEMTKIIASERGIRIDETRFNELLEQQRRRAKAATKMSDSIFVASEIEKEIAGIPETEFNGYETHKTGSRVLWTRLSDSQGIIALDRTPFYPEGGGQAGDSGKITADEFEFAVTDTQKKGKVILHYGELTRGKVRKDVECSAEIDLKRRNAIKRNHTATHLLQAALRQILGQHVRQVGSLVNEEKLRFDFAHGKALNKNELKKIEQWVNEAIMDNIQVGIRQESYEQAAKAGALAFFGEKYSDRVRVVEMPGKTKELCGGTHCRFSGEIGAFLIASESSVGSGTRRIEALTGQNALDYFNAIKESLVNSAALMNSTPEELPEKINTMKTELKKLAKSGERHNAAALTPDLILGQSKQIGAGHLVYAAFCDENIASLRALADTLRQKSKKSVIALFATHENKVSAILALSKDLENRPADIRPAGNQLAALLEGSFGGRKDWIQGGGKNVGGIDAAVQAIEKNLEQLIGEYPCKF